MSEEQSFLNALAAHPADDTTRLVYADWLDDRGESAKAEYLRLVVGLVPHYTAAAPDPPQAERVQALAEQLPRDWRGAAAARFAVVLHGYEPPHKIHAIKLVRELTGWGLAEAKKFVEAVPARFPMRTTLEDALGLRDRLRAASSIRVEVHPDDLDELPRLGSYRVSAYLGSPDWYGEAPAGAVPTEAFETFAAFLTAAGLPANRAAELARGEEAVVVADGLEPSQLPGRMDRLTALLPPPDDGRGWEIVLYSWYHVSPPLPKP